MEVRNLIENIRNIADVLLGAGCLFLAGAVGVACCLWRKRKMFLAVMLLVAGMVFMRGVKIQAATTRETEAISKEQDAIETEAIPKEQDAGKTEAIPKEQNTIETDSGEDKAEDASGEAVREVYITGFQRRDDSGREEEGLWLYNTEAEILLLLEETDEIGEREYPVESETVEECESSEPVFLLKNKESISIQMQKQESGWVSLAQDEWTEYGIQYVQKEENRAVWYLRICKEARYRLFFRDEEGNCRQQQEVVIDWTVPTAKTVSIIGTESEKEAVIRNGVRYAGEPLQICVDIQDENVLESVRCEGYAESGEKLFETDCTAQDSYSCIVPMDFCGYMRWYIKDICENETVYEPDSHFCTESRETCIANSKITVERCDEASDYCRESMVLRFYAASEWSGISSVRIQEGAAVLLEEEIPAGRITQWERILTVTPQSEGNVSILVTLTSLSGQTVSVRRNWIKDITAPLVRTEWEGKGNNGYFQTPGVLHITIEETHFLKELWNITYQYPSGREENINWDAAGNGVYQCRILFSEDGKYALKISGADPAGNAMRQEGRSGSGSASFTWVVDTKSPDIEIAGVENAKHYGQMPEITIRTEDENPDFDKFTWNLSGSETEQIACTAVRQQGEIRLSFPQMPRDDTYRLQVESCDLAGNYRQKMVSFTLNTKGSSYQIKGLGEKNTFTAGPKLEIIECNKSPIIEYQVVYVWEGIVRLLKEEEDYQVEKTEENEYRNRYIFSGDLFQKEGYYNLIVISKDAAGNTVSTQKNAYAYVPVRFSVDKTPPVILIEEMQKNAMEPGKTELRMQIMENQNLKNLHILANEKEIVPGDDGSIVLDMEGGNAVLQIEAEDAAGNKVYMEKRFGQEEEEAAEAKISDKLYKEKDRGSVHAAVAAGIVLILLISLILFYFWKKKACIGNFPML